MIGTLLADRLMASGHKVRLLTRNPNKEYAHAAFGWDIGKKQIDVAALQDLDVIINLAGAPIAGARWSTKRKAALRNSRVEGNHLLRQVLENQGIQVQQFIGASAVGYYGDRGAEELVESSTPGDGFLSELCVEWEESQLAFQSVAQQVASVRVGLVMAKEGGVLPTLNRSIIFGVGTSLGSGHQYMPWIHIDDLLRIFECLVSRGDLAGVFNGVAPTPVPHRDFMRSLTKRHSGLGLTIPVPAFLIKMFMGEMAQIVLNSNRVIPQRLENVGFAFNYVSLDSALDALLT